MTTPPVAFVIKEPTSLDTTLKTLAKIPLDGGSGSAAIRFDPNKCKQSTMSLVPLDGLSSTSRECIARLLEYGSLDTDLSVTCRHF